MKIEKGKFYRTRNNLILYCRKVEYSSFCEYDVIYSHNYDKENPDYINGWITGSRGNSEFTGDIVTESNHPEDVIEEISEDIIKEKYPEYLI
jgi:hypothetical protein